MVQPRGNKHFPDISTANRRKIQFAPASERFVPRGEIVRRLHSNPKKRGHNVTIYNTTLRALSMIERMWAHRKLGPEETLLAQAMYVNRKACEYADHGLIGIKNPLKTPDGKSTFVGINDPEILSSIGLSANDPHREKRAWEYYFNGFLECFSKDKRVKGGQAIYEKVVEIERYTGLSEKLYRLRTKHGTEIDKIARRLIGQAQKPEENLLAEVRRVLSRPWIEYKYVKSTLTLERARALDICVAVSIYADVLERTQGKEWPTAYAEGMLQIYPEIKKYPGIYDAITTMD